MTGLRRWTVRVVGILIGIGISVAAAWAVRGAPWTENLTFLGGVVLVAPIYAAWLWTVHNRGRLIARADETSDEANRALGLAEEANHYAGQAYDAVRGVIKRVNGQGRAEMGRERPESLLDGLTAAPWADTDPLTLRAQKGAQAVTAPRPAVDAIPGGTRLAGATASGRGRHAAPDDRKAGAQ